MEKNESQLSQFKAGDKVRLKFQMQELHHFWLFLRRRKNHGRCQ
jgi:hypothetical protein